MPTQTAITHIAGTFLIHAQGAFLNGAGLGQGDDRNVTIPKTFRDGRGGEVPYVSAQAWKRWLRNTAVEEAGWAPSEVQAIGWSTRGTVNKIAGELNPVEFPEDDIFGYMRATKGQGQTADAPDEDAGEESDTEKAKTRAIMRASPFAASLLMSLRSRDWRGQDEGFVHLTKFDPKALAEAEIGRFLTAVSPNLSSSEKRRKQPADVWKLLQDFDKKLAESVKQLSEQHDLDGVRKTLAERAVALTNKGVDFIENATSPLPYKTRFYSTHLQAVFCLDYARLGVFWNLGDRIELEPAKVKELLARKTIRDITNEEPYKTLSRDGALGKIYALTDDTQRKSRASALLRSLAVLRGGAKQAQFGTDVAPKVIVLAGLTCGNPIFNQLFADADEGPRLKVATFKEILADYSDRIVTPVFVGMRAGYLSNENEVAGLQGFYYADGKNGLVKLESPPEPVQSGASFEIRITSPIQAAKEFGDLLN